MIERGNEGLVAKDEASAYTSGATRAWLKVKQPGWTMGGRGRLWGGSVVKHASPACKVAVLLRY